MNPIVSNSFQTFILERALELEGQSKALEASVCGLSVQELRSVANDIGLGQIYVEQALSESQVQVPSFGHAGPLSVHHYIAKPVCHIHQSTLSYMDEHEGMDVDQGIPLGFTFKNSFDYKRFSYDHSERSMWTLTGVKCVVTPMDQDGAVVSLYTDSVSERAATLTGALATAIATAPIFGLIDGIYTFFPFSTGVNQILAGLLGAATGAVVGAFMGQLWWHEEIKSKTKVLVRAVDGIVQTAITRKPAKPPVDDEEPQLVASVPAHPKAPPLPKPKFYAQP